MGRLVAEDREPGERAAHQEERGDPPDRVAPSTARATITPTDCTHTPTTWTALRTFGMRYSSSRSAPTGGRWVRGVGRAGRRGAASAREASCPVGRQDRCVGTSAVMPDHVTSHTTDVAMCKDRPSSAGRRDGRPATAAQRPVGGACRRCSAPIRRACRSRAWSGSTRCSASAEGTVRTALSRMVAAGRASTATATAGTRSPAACSPARPASGRARSADGGVVGPLAHGGRHRRTRAARPNGPACARAMRAPAPGEHREGVWLRPDNLDRRRLPDARRLVDEQCRWFVGPPRSTTTPSSPRAVGPRRLGGDGHSSCAARMVGWSTGSTTATRRARAGVHRLGRRAPPLQRRPAPARELLPAALAGHRAPRRLRPLRPRLPALLGCVRCDPWLGTATTRWRTVLDATMTP